MSRVLALCSGVANVASIVAHRIQIGAGEGLGLFAIRRFDTGNRFVGIATDLEVLRHTRLIAHVVADPQSDRRLLPVFGSGRDQHVQASLLFVPYDVLAIGFSAEQLVEVAVRQSLPVRLWSS